MKQILSLDGGGVRGVIALAFLERIEALDPVARPLYQRFQLIGGTSTGAIIAAAAARGLSARQIRDFYFKLAPKVFKTSRMHIPGIHSRFDAEALRSELRSVFGDLTLDTDQLLTGFALVAKRMDTGSPWVVSNNPHAPFFATPENGSFIGNGEYKLVDLIRASTAAPHYFAPERVPIVRGEPDGLFVDGGVSPHNNPALALFQLVAFPRSGYGWKTGVSELRIVSIGTGSFRHTLTLAEARRTPAVGLAIKALASMIGDAQQQVLTTMQLLGKSLTPVVLNAEIGDMTDIPLLPDRLFEFARYDVQLTREWMRTNLRMNLTDKQIDQLRQLGNPDVLPLAHEIGAAAAEQQVKAEHLSF